MPDFASCCVLSYNRPRFLETALTSLIEKAGAPLELIVHDDGSDEEERRDIFAFCDGLMSDGLLSTLIVNPPGHNQGQGIALNRMFQMAKGDPIIKLDHDLVFGDDWLAQTNEILERNRRTKRKKETGADYAEPRIGLLGLFHYHYEPVQSMKCLRAQHRGWQEHTHICGSAFAMPREAWRRLGPFEEHSDAFAEDYVMQLAVTNSEDYVCGLPDGDLMENQGFGYGRSTLALAPGEVKTIHKEPVIIGRTEVPA